MVMIVLSAQFVFSQENCETQNQKIYFMVEGRWTSHIQKNEEDFKSSQYSILSRVMISKRLGFVGLIQTNDSSTVALGGITVLGSKNFRLDVLVGTNMGDATTSAVSVRVWVGSENQDLWVNGIEGKKPFWFEAIYLMRIADWISIGAMGQTVGVGPRVDIHLPGFENFTVWATALSNWKNTAAEGNGYDPQTWVTVGAKAVF